MADDSIAQALITLGEAITQSQGAKFVFSYSDRGEARKALLVDQLHENLYDIDQFCRTQMKHGDISDDAYDMLQYIRDMAWKGGALDD